MSELSKSVFTGKTIEEAIEAAKADFGVSEVEYTVLEEPKKGLFGHRPGSIEAWVKQQEKQESASEPQPEIKPQEAEPVSDTEEPEVEVTTEKSERTEEYLRGILDNMDGESAKITVKETTKQLIVSINGDDIAFLIGRRGETLDALQYLTSLAVNRGEDTFLKISLDINGYRAKREATLRSLGRKLAKQVLRTGASIKLEPMNPYERRLIHSAVHQIEGVTSESTGTDPHRCVVISSTNPDAVRKSLTRKSDKLARTGARDMKKRDFSDRKRDYSDKKPYNKSDNYCRPVQNPDSIIKDDFLMSETSIEKARKSIEEEYSTPLYGKIDLENM